MNRTLSISVIALIALVMVVGIVTPAMAKEGNNGNNGCEKSGNGKSCEANPNTDLGAYTCASCLEKYHEDLAAGSPTAILDFHSCNEIVEITTGEYCSPVPPGGF